jgi:hypothetical protein
MELSQVQGMFPGDVALETGLLLDSRVVIGQILRNSLFLQAFCEGRGRGGNFGKSRLISSPYVLSMMCKTPESNKSLLKNFGSEYQIAFA